MTRFPMKTALCAASAGLFGWSIPAEANGDIPSCPNYTGGTEQGSKSSKSSSTKSSSAKSSSAKSSKGKGKTFFSPKKSSKSSSNKCEDGTVEEVTCFDSDYVNATLTLFDDLYCKGSGTIITMEGPDALLDCKGNTIRGTLSGTGVELINGASIVNCDIMNVNVAIETTGEGCSTIDRVSASYIGDDAIKIQNTGRAILTDIVVEAVENNGIEIEVDASGEVLVAIENAQVTGAFENGICFLEAPSDGATVEFYGDIVLKNTEDDALDIDEDSNFNLTIYGTFSASGSGEYGIDNESGSTVTFAESSTSEICFNSDGDLNGAFTVEDEATVVCTTGTGSGVCTAPCADIQNKTEACVVVESVE